MPFATKINTLIWVQEGEEPGAWVAGPQVVVTKNSVTAAVEPESAAGKTAIRLNDGSSIRVNATLQQIEDFLNNP